MLLVQYSDVGGTIQGCCWYNTEMLEVQYRAVVGTLQGLSLRILLLDFTFIQLLKDEGPPHSTIHKIWKCTNPLSMSTSPNVRADYYYFRFEMCLKMHLICVPIVFLAFKKKKVGFHICVHKHITWTLQVFILLKGWLVHLGGRRGVAGERDPGGLRLLLLHHHRCRRSRQGGADTSTGYKGSNEKYYPTGNFPIPSFTGKLYKKRFVILTIH